MTVSKRLVIAFVSISVFVLALMGIAWSAMSDVLEVLKAGSLTAQQSQNLMAEVERSRWWLLALGAWVCISCTWSWIRSVGQVTGLLSEISGALQQQSEGIAHVNTAVAHMDSTNQENAALVMQATQAAAALNARTQDLQQAVGAFKLDDDESPCLAPSAMPAPRGAGAAQARPARARELAYEEL
ncbi:hypothetical protein [Comamonas thiooxydans]|uniref:hypothetical protein n=1 Tax=Comamonas thiooxydans TaxID=363952 RepID=UPI00265E2FE3|nr:hypothetical protein [Comamonas thiooxydans]MDO1472852.1 hypothetical protein [Comamonas thiooxydans]